MKKTIGILAIAAVVGTSTLVGYGVAPSSTGSGSNNSGQSGTVNTRPAGQQAPNPIRLGQQPAGGDAHAGHNHAPGQHGQAQPNASATPLWKNYNPPSWAQDWDHIDLETARKWNQDPTVVFVDARAKVEYDQSHIPGAIPMPLGEFDKYYAEYETKIKNASKLVTYCHGIGCKLSDKVAQRLYRDKGHKNVASFFGGWPQWSQANLPTE